MRALLFLLVAVACKDKNPECGGPWYADADGDGYGDPAAESAECEAPAGHVDNADDCDDASAAASPEGTEACDGLDNNCDGQTDEGVLSTFYADGDGDGYGTDGDTQEACEAPSGYAAEGGDCADDDPAFSPGADETCDGVDNNCDGQTDESTAIDATDYYADADEDGFGDPNGLQRSCAAPSGFTTDNTDCDDTYALRYPGATEVCNDGVVNDCGSTEEIASQSCQLDVEEDLAEAGSRMFGISRDDQAGNKVAEAGDPTGDGFADVLIGSALADHGATNNGAAYLVAAHPGEPDLSLAYLRLWGVAAEDKAGSAVASSGDLHIGGVPGVLVGAIGESSAASGAGAAYLVSAAQGGELTLSSADAVMYGVTSGDQAGYAVAAVGDLNSDGVADLLVGAPYSDEGGANAGEVYVVSGTVSGEFSLANAVQALAGESADDLAGSALAGLGDANGDGVADYAVGAYAENSNGVNAGAVYVLYGPATTRSDLSWANVVYRGDANGDYAGFALAGGEDTNGDGYTELLIGAPRAGNQDNGAAWIVSPHSAASAEVDLGSETAKFTGERFDDFMGTSVDFLGDVNGDGEADVILGAPGADGGGVASGEAYFFAGPFAGTMSALNANTTIIGALANDAAGTSVSRAGDVDGDGNQDMLIGAIGEDTNGAEAGVAYILFGPGI